MIQDTYSIVMFEYRCLSLSYSILYCLTEGYSLNSVDYFQIFVQEEGRVRFRSGPVLSTFSSSTDLITPGYIKTVGEISFDDLYNRKKE